MITFKEFLLLEDNTEAKVISDYLQSFDGYQDVVVTQKKTVLTIKMKADIDNSLDAVNKALDKIGYEIDNADNSEDGYVVYKAVPLG